MNDRRGYAIKGCRLSVVEYSKSCVSSPQSVPSSLGKRRVTVSCLPIPIEWIGRELFLMDEEQSCLGEGSRRRVV